MKKVKLFLLITALLAIFCLTLYACGPQEKEEKTDYIIQYEFEGIQQLNVKKGQMFALQKIPQKTGYRFLGLFDAEIGGTQYVNQNGASVAAFQEDRNLVLYARFQPITYTIILDYQGGEIGQNIESLTAEYDAVVPELPIAVEKEHYVFKGWYTRPDSQGQRISDDRGVLPDISAFSNAFFEIPAEGTSIRLYAGYEIVKYKVTLYLMENPSEFVEQNIAHGTLASEIKVEDSNGKTIVTWAKSKADAASGNAYNGPIESETILYGCGYGYGVTLKDESGQIIQSDFLAVGREMSLPVLEDNEYYIFAGWQFNGQIYQDKFILGSPSPAELHPYYKQKYEDYIYIRTAEEFKQISRNLSGKYMLLEDIDLGSSWTPIGTYTWDREQSPDKPFSGEIEGNGKVISYKLKVVAKQRKNRYAWGIFGATENATIKNVQVKADISNDWYDIISTCSYAGGIIGYAVNTEIINCKVQGKISQKCSANEDYGINRCGGVVGIAYYSQISSCENRAEVYASSFNAAAAGIAGGQKGSEFNSCNNYASIRADHGDWIFGAHYINEIYINSTQGYNRTQMLVNCQKYE